LLAGDHRFVTRFARSLASFFSQFFRFVGCSDPNGERLTLVTVDSGGMKIELQIKCLRANVSLERNTFVDKVE
jgi:hypothetical protein